ncbi:hypothetical protein ABES25_23340, partial [Bacillus gobiensis]|uniref:hypothetical protein n=1 Tax=Bacillus gobiensis TaxID=1441095 RepID=UPI003D1CC171
HAHQANILKYPQNENFINSFTVLISRYERIRVGYFYITYNKNVIECLRAVILFFKGDPNGRSKSRLCIDKK